MRKPILGMRFHRSSKVEQPKDQELDSRTTEIPKETHKLGSELMSRCPHPVYTDGKIVMIGDVVRSHKDTMDGKLYEGEVAVVASSAVLCIPPHEAELWHGICDSLYLVRRGPSVPQEAFVALMKHNYASEFENAPRSL